MPYFTRQPYAAPPPPPAQAAAPDILALAAEVLAQETGATRSACAPPFARAARAA